MQNRMNRHYGNSEVRLGCIPQEAFAFLKECVYTETESIADSIVLEAYLIARYKPAYNREFMTDDVLTLEMDISKYEWKKWDMKTDDNPDHHIFIWKDGVLLYEIPKIREVYTPLKNELGLTMDMNFQYGQRFKDGEYELMRLTAKRRVTAGTMRQIPKYQYMGYPKEINEWQAQKRGQEQYA